MSGTRGRSFWIALALGAVAAWALRAAPLLRWGAWGYGVYYDEGVYFSAAALWARGAWPYRDFVLVHPPGALWALLPFGLLARGWAISKAFAACRWSFPLVGAATAGVLGLGLRRRLGEVGALAAVLAYAVNPHAVGAENGPYLEPLLNLACVLGAVGWLADSARPRLVLLAGVAFGAAIAVKSWGALWAVPVLLTAGGRRAQLRWLALGALGGFGLLAWPALLAPGEAFSQVVGFQLTRPLDGIARGERFGVVFGHKTVGLWLAAGAGAVMLVRGGAAEVRRAGLFFGAAALAVLAAFVASPVFHTEYLAHLGLPLAGLIGCGVAAALSGAAGAMRWAVSALLLAAVAPSVRAAAFFGVSRFEGYGQLRARWDAPPNATVMAFEPAWLLAIDRLPAGDQPWADPYGLEVGAAVSGSGRLPTTGACFETAASQALVQQALNRTDDLLCDRTCEAQLGTEGRARRDAMSNVAEFDGVTWWRRR